MNCHCPRKCLQDELTIGHIQYGKYQGDKYISRAKMLTSVMLYLKPEQKTLQLELGFLRFCEHIYRFCLLIPQQEHIEYEATQFFSDVGGAVGLILGISCTTVFGIIGQPQHNTLSSSFEPKFITFSEYLTAQTINELYYKWKRLRRRRKQFCNASTQIDLSC